MTTTDDKGATPSVASTGIDWARLARRFAEALAFSALVGAAIYAEERRRKRADDLPARVAPLVPDAEREAAALLGVELDADEKAIRAALRKKLATTHAHPDQGGDLAVARRLIAARDLLVERARARAAS